MRVLAIDPGYERLGVAVMEKQNGAEVLLHSSCVETSKELEIEDRLLLIGEQLQKLVAEYTPDLVAVETLFFNKNQKTAIAVAEARGVVLYIAKSCGADILELSPQQIKVGMTGHGGSDKKAVTDMVKRLIKGVPTKAHDDEYDAIAIAVTALAHYRHV